MLFRCLSAVVLWAIGSVLVSCGGEVEGSSWTMGRSALLGATCDEPVRAEPVLALQLAIPEVSPQGAAFMEVVEANGKEFLVLVLGSDLRTYDLSQAEDGAILEPAGSFVFRGGRAASDDSGSMTTARTAAYGGALFGSTGHFLVDDSFQDGNSLNLSMVALDLSDPTFPDQVLQTPVTNLGFDGDGDGDEGDTPLRGLSVVSADFSMRDILPSGWVLVSAWGNPRLDDGYYALPLTSRGLSALDGSHPINLTQGDGYGPTGLAGPWYGLLASTVSMEVGLKRSFATVRSHKVSLPGGMKMDWRNVSVHGYDRTREGSTVNLVGESSLGSVNQIAPWVSGDGDTSLLVSTGETRIRLRDGVVSSGYGALYFISAAHLDEAALPARMIAGSERRQKPPVRLVVRDGTLYSLVEDEDTDGGTATLRVMNLCGDSGRVTHVAAGGTAFQ